MARKTEPYKVTGIRPCGEITDEMLATEEWRNHALSENIMGAKAIGGKPKKEVSESHIEAI